jgi:hypothetical protein
MNIKQTSLAAAIALAAIGSAHAEGLKPLQGEIIDLGDVSGVVYYTVERDGFRVVATLARGGRGAHEVIEGRLIGDARKASPPSSSFSRNKPNGGHRG